MQRNSCARMPAHRLCPARWRSMQGDAETWLNAGTADDMLLAMEGQRHSPSLARAAAAAADEEMELESEQSWQERHDVDLDDDAMQFPEQGHEGAAGDPMQVSTAPGVPCSGSMAASSSTCMHVSGRRITLDWLPPQALAAVRAPRDTVQAESPDLHPPGRLPTLTTQGTQPASGLRPCLEALVTEAGAASSVLQEAEQYLASTEGEVGGVLTQLHALAQLVEREQGPEGGQEAPQPRMQQLHEGVHAAIAQASAAVAGLAQVRA